MAAFKNVVTGYYIIDCTEIKRKEIETSGETHLNFLHHKKENQAKFVTLFWDS